MARTYFNERRVHFKENDKIVCGLINADSSTDPQWSNCNRCNRILQQRRRKQDETPRKRVYPARKRIRNYHQNPPERINCDGCEDYVLKSITRKLRVTGTGVIQHYCPLCVNKMNIQLFQRTGGREVLDE